MTNYLINYRRTRVLDYIAGVIPLPAINIRPITIDHTKCGTANSTDFPLLFAGTYDGTGGEPDLRTTANGGGVLDANGYDICFYSDAACTTMLDFERVSWSGTTGACEFYIRIPTLSFETDTVIYLAYGNSVISTDQQDADGTWNSNHVAVYHFEGDSSDSNGSYDGASSNMAYDATTPKYNQHATFNGTSSRIDLGTSANLAPAAMTVIVWVYCPNFTAIQSITQRENGGYATYNSFNLSTTGRLRSYCTGSSGGFALDGSAGTQISINTWTRIAWTYSSTQGLITYVSGNQDRTVAAGGTLNCGSGETNVGWEDVNNRWFGSGATGYMDNLYFLNIAASSSYITSDFNNQNSPSTFYTIT